MSNRQSSPQIDRISEQEIEREYDYRVKLRGEYRERAGVKLFCLMLIVIGVCAVGSFLLLYANKITFDETMRILDVLVVKAFIPILAVVLGHTLRGKA